MAAQFVVVQYSSEIPPSLFTLSDSLHPYSSRPRVVILDADMINHRLVFLGNLVYFDYMRSFGVEFHEFF
ncbi:hypothetical protein ACFX2I_016764 [Malus domestica]